MVSAVTNLSIMIVHVACVVNIAMCRFGGIKSFIMQNVVGLDRACG